MPVVTSGRLSILNRDKEIMVLTSEFCKYNFGGQKWPVRPKIVEGLVKTDAQCGQGAFTDYWSQAAQR